MSNSTSNAATAQPQHSANGARTSANGAAGALFSVSDVAAKLNLKPQKVGGKLEYHGANPTGDGATKDGFILFEAGNATDRNGQKYTSPQVAKMAGLSPDEYAPFLEWKARSGHNSPNGTQTPPKRAESPQNGNGQDGAKPTNGAAPFPWARAQTFDYCDESGALLFQVGRIGEGAAKEIRQRRPDGRGGWLYSLGDVRRVLWRLPDVLAAQTVFLCEGEKAAAALNFALEKSGQLGAIATTNAQGAGKWRDEFCESLDGKAVCVLPDFDETGDKHGAAVCASIHASGRAAAVCRLDLPGLPPKGDVCDWFESGATVADLLELRDASPLWEPETPEVAREIEPHEHWPLLSLDELFARPDPTWLIDLLLPDGAVAWITASHASFKSVAALDAMMCVATGTQFHGRDVRQGRAIYVAAEGISGIRQRAKAWLIRHQLPTPPPENIAFIERPVQIGDAAKMAAFIRQMEAAKPDFLVIDTQARCSVGMDENSTSDSTVFWGAIADLARATGAAILVVHHNNKSGEYRGNSNAPASVDVHLSIKREGQKASLRCLKQKDADEENAHINFVSRVIDLGILDAKGRPQTSIILEATDEPFADEKPTSKSKTERTADAVLEVLVNLHREKGKVTKTEWADAVVEKAKICKKTAFYDHLKTLEDAGKWGWAYGDCAPTQQKRPFSEFSEFSENGKNGNAESDLTELSEFSAFSGRLEEPEKTENGKGSPKPKTTRQIAASESEPYAAPETNR